MAKWLVALFVVVVFGGLCLAVGFSWKQAVLLALIAVYVEHAFLQAAPKRKATFDPYYVRIQPNWYVIFKDYSIVKTDDDWPKFREWREGKELPNVWYSVLRNDQDGILVYLGADGGFRTSFDFEWEVTKRLLHSIERLSPEGFPYAIDLFLKQKFDVIQIGLRVKSDWWKSVSADCANPLEVREEHLYGTAVITLAQLPLGEFNLHWVPIEYGRGYVDKVQNSMNKGREEHGWNEAEKYDGLPSGIQPTILKSKYFTVEHNSIR